MTVILPTILKRYQFACTIFLTNRVSIRIVGIVFAIKEVTACRLVYVLINV